mmetsp:Transcript_24352/g.28665  ORF Transcript_24352/g.28665 Transcript_24352/m.28665 type:complete len:133 (+) Transcript_24352:172-570(+)
MINEGEEIERNAEILDVQSIEFVDDGDLYINEASLLSADRDNSLLNAYEESEKWKRKAFYEKKIGFGSLFDETSTPASSTSTTASNNLFHEKDNQKEEEFNRLLKLTEEQSLRIAQLESLLAAKKGTSDSIS